MPTRRVASGLEPHSPPPSTLEKSECVIIGSTWINNKCSPESQSESRANRNAHKVMPSMKRGRHGPWEDTKVLQTACQSDIARLTHQKNAMGNRSYTDSYEGRRNWNRHHYLRETISDAGRCWRK